MIQSLEKSATRPVTPKVQHYVINKPTMSKRHEPIRLPFLKSRTFQVPLENKGVHHAQATIKPNYQNNTLDIKHSVLLNPKLFFAKGKNTLVQFSLSFSISNFITDGNKKALPAFISSLMSKQLHKILMWQLGQSKESDKIFVSKEQLPITEFEYKQNVKEFAKSLFLLMQKQDYSLTTKNYSSHASALKLFGLDFDQEDIQTFIKLDPNPQIPKNLDKHININTQPAPPIGYSFQKQFNDAWKVLINPQEMGYAESPVVEFIRKDFVSPINLILWTFFVMTTLIVNLL